MEAVNVSKKSIKNTENDATLKKKKGLSFEAEALIKENQNISSKGDSRLGCLEDCTEIHGDIVSPVMDEKEWECLGENGISRNPV